VGHDVAVEVVAAAVVAVEVVEAVAPAVAAVPRAVPLRASYSLAAVVHHLGATAFAGHYATSVRQTRHPHSARAAKRHAAPVSVSSSGAQAAAATAAAAAPAQAAASSGASRGGSSWMRFDDSVTRAVGEAEVMGAATKEGYIFFFTAD
jgi:hypothetical protein